MINATPPGFEIDPATGMPRLVRRQTAAATNTLGPTAAFTPTARSTDDPLNPTAPTTRTPPATTGATFAPPAGTVMPPSQSANTRTPPSEPPPPVQPPIPAGLDKNPYDVLKWAYKTFLGRDPSQQEMDAQLGQGGVSTQQIVDSIFNSQEAESYRATHPTSGGTTASGGGGSFSGTSTAADLITALNSGNGAPGSDAFTKLIQQYMAATGLKGGAGNGYDYGQYDASRQKIYLPGFDIRYENGQWVSHPWGNGSDAPTATSNTSITTPPVWQQDPAIHDAILKLLQGGQTPVSADDPTIKATTDAARVAGTRQVQQARASAAERASAEGLPTGAFDNAVMGNQEKFGENMSGLEAQLMTTELQNRRAQVVNALQFAGAEDARSLQAYLGNIDAALRKAQLGQQNQQFYDDLSFRGLSEQDLMNRFMTSQLTGA